jgi:hypothetical protein
MISGVIFDFDNTIYDYDICNKNSLSKVFTHIEDNFKKENVKDVYEKINIDIKQSNNYCNKFNKNIYFTSRSILNETKDLSLYFFWFFM